MRMVTAMREIKFRGRSINYVAANDSYWAYGLLVNDDPPEIECDDGDIYRVNDDTVGQYTGLEDADGREIYEGDIVEISPQFSAKQGLKRKFHLFAVVRWDERLARFVVISKEILDSIPDSECVSVIGNIHDNPELLEATE